MPMCRALSAPSLGPYTNFQRRVSEWEEEHWGAGRRPKRKKVLEAQDCPLPTHRTPKEEPDQNAEIRDFFGYERNRWVYDSKLPCSIGPLMRGYLRHPYVAPKPLGGSQQTSSAKEWEPAPRYGGMPNQ